jgi:hypothetical protein
MGVQMNHINGHFGLVKTFRYKLLLGLFFGFSLVITPSIVKAQTPQQLAQQLSSYKVYDVFKDGVYVYVLASKPTLNGKKYSHPFGDVFPQKDLYILKIAPTGDLKSTTLDSALAIGTGTLLIAENTITAFVNFKAADNSYDMSGVVFKIDKTTNAIPNKTKVFNDMNAGWSPKILQNGIEHFNFSKYNRVLDTSDMGKVDPQTMTDEYNIYRRNHSGNILSTSSLTDTEIANNVATYIQTIDPIIIKNERAKNAAYQAADAKENEVFRKILSSKDPKKMYISAGKYTAKGEKDKAMEIYSAIMDRFPEHDLAIKATDKLTAMHDVDVRQPTHSTMKQQVADTSFEKCTIGSDIVIREKFSTSTSSGNILADGLFGAAAKEEFLVEYYGIVKSFMGNKVEVFYQNYNVIQEKGGGLFSQRTDKKYLIAESADKKMGRSVFHDKSVCN